MQTKKPPFDTSFAKDFHWTKPEHDLQIVMLILGGHTERETCPAGAAEHAEIQRLLASNPDTPSAVLDHMTKCVRSPKILERIAANPTTSVEALRWLARHECNDVRSAVAENTNADTETIMALAHDTHTDVRFRLAENHDLPSEILEILCTDENPYVAYRAQMTRTRIYSSQRAPGQTQQFPVDQDGRQRSIRRAV